MEGFVTMTISKETHAELKALSERERRPMAAILRDALEEYQQKRRVVYVNADDWHRLTDDLVD